MVVAHQLRREQRDEYQKYRVEQQVREMEVLPVRVPFHLQILLTQRMGQKLNSAVVDHRLMWAKQKCSLRHVLLGDPMAVPCTASVVDSSGVLMINTFKGVRPYF